jgi:hypothetical protein
VLLPQLRRIRWAVRATLLLGVAASVLANILHALDNPISQAIAAWPPVALLLTVELISRVPVGRRLLAAARLIATAIIASIAAWVSYWHMAGVAARYGETGASPYLLPLSVDGLIVVASICLVELGGRIASLEHPATAPAASQPTAMAPEHAAPTANIAASRSAGDILVGQPGDEVSHIMVDAFPEEPAPLLPALSPTLSPDPGLIRAAAARTGANPVVTAGAGSIQTGSTRAGSTRAGSTQAGAARAGSTQAGATRAGSARVAEGGSSVSAVEMPSPLRRSTAAALAEAATALPRSTTGFNPTVTPRGNPQHLGRSLGTPGNGRASTNGGAPGNGRGATNGGAAMNGRASTNGRGGADAGSAPAQRRADSSAKNAPAGRSRRTPVETVALAARIKAERPAITEADLAAELGISPSRWRSVRREAAQTADTELAA